MQSVLIIVAHPDDETLMAGGTIHRLVDEGYSIGVVTVASSAGARALGADHIAENQIDALELLGIKKENVFNLDLPDSQLSTVPHLELVRKIEDCIQTFKPDLIITHYPKDNHSDHKCVSQAVQEAMRWFQRPKGQTPCMELWYGEVPSSTDWSLDTQFHPNVWIDITKEHLLTKIAALDVYKEVIRPVPHPRSMENLKALSRIRGAQCGSEYAEAFQQVFRVIPWNLRSSTRRQL